MQELYKLKLFEDTTDDEIEWLARNSQVVSLAQGDYFIRENDPARQFYVVIEGELQVTRLINGAERVMGTTPKGIIGGELALLNGTSSPVTVRAIVPSRLLVFELRAFREMFAACPTVGARILRIAAERTTGLAGMLKQQEKMAALGKLSAGLAHELNNPAAAARRATKTLHDTLPLLQTQAVRLNTLGLDDHQLGYLTAFQQQAVARASTAAPLSTLEQSDREEVMSDWLAEHGIENGWELAPTFVAAHISVDELAQLITPLAPHQVGDLLNWLHTGLTAASLLNEIEQSTQRISNLVGAVKAYTYMDQAALQEVDIHQGLENTLVVLKHKLKHINLVREYDPGLPRIMAHGSELNQVWTNLIDNAIDALAGNGTIRLITRCENNFAMVEVADNGPGIPDHVLPRIFEPFFTTKDVGVGTGLGLDITYRIITQHNGTLEVQSQPGLTRFIVRLPVGATGERQLPSS